MAWDFSTEPEFAEKLEWMRGFVRDEIIPLETLDLDGVRASGYAFQIELNVRTWKKGFRIKEVPIIFYDRAAGVSKMSKKIMGEAIWIVWLLRLKALFGLLK